MTDRLLAPVPTRRFAVGVALLVGLALVIVAGAAPPSHAAEDVRLTQPGSGARVEGPTPVRVEVDARPLGEVKWVEARLRRGGEIVGSAARLSHEGGERTSGGTSTWAAQWDPASGWINGGEPLANGEYLVEARAHSEVGLGEGETTEWSGHSVTVSQPAATPQLQAQRRDDGQAVALQWSQAGAPDFVRYELERAPDGGAFEAVAQISSRGETTYRDDPPAGVWHYRVTTVRRDGSGGEVSATSGTATVETTEPAEEEEEDSGGDGGADSGEDGGADSDGDGDGPSPTPTPDDAEDSGGDDDGLTVGSGDGDGDAGGEGGQTGEGQREGDGGSSAGSSGGPDLREGGGADPPSPSSGESSVPQLGAGEAEAREPVAGDAAGDAGGSDDGTFSRELPYEDPEREREREDDSSEAEVAQADPPASRGMITVGDQELALERILPPMAGGLLLFVTAGHILRLRQRLD